VTGTATVDAATAAIALFVRSLAANKVALGRRYGEWAVSAPTLESAVAAAAITQDEIGHARSLFPFSRQLAGLPSSDADDDLAGSGAVLPFISAPLPDWTAFVAANLVIDGAFTTAVAAARDSAVEGLAQRARKILQEEAAHQVHAEAWTRRLGRGGGPTAGLLRDHLERAWAEAARWLGPAGDPGVRAALAGGMLAEDGAASRERLRGRLAAVLASAGLRLELPEPASWDAWDPELRV
jgi:phenylacetate-CoA oxygenase PaaI subunit